MGLCKNPNLLLYRLCEEFSSQVYKSKFEMPKCDRYEIGRTLYTSVLKLAAQCARVYKIEDNEEKYKILTSEIIEQYYIINLIVEQVIHNDIVKKSTKIQYASYIQKIYEQLKKWENYLKKFKKINNSNDTIKS